MVCLVYCISRACINRGYTNSMGVAEEWESPSGKKWGEKNDFRQKQQQREKGNWAMCTPPKLFGKALNTFRSSAHQRITFYYFWCWRRDETVKVLLYLPRTRSHSHPCTGTGMRLHNHSIVERVHFTHHFIFVSSALIIITVKRSTTSLALHSHRAVVALSLSL